MQSTGKYMIIIGALVIFAGLILWLFGNKLNWLGNLPGDIKIEKENFKLYFPLTTMILFSLVVTVVMWCVRKLTG